MGARRERGRMNQITLEELLELLAIVPQKTVFELGAPPANICNSLSLEVYCVLPAEQATRMQETAKRIWASHAPPPAAPNGQASVRPCKRNVPRRRGKA